MRDFDQIIGQIIDVVPENEELRKQLEHTRYSAAYKPPECMGEMWAVATRQIAGLIPNDPKDMNDWQLKVASILGDREVALFPKNAVILKKGGLFLRRNDKGWVLDDVATPIDLKAADNILDYSGLGKIDSFEIIRVEM